VDFKISLSIGNFMIKNPILAAGGALLIWLLLGAPALEDSGNLLLYAVTVFHLYTVIWNQEIFKLFRADEFTYAGASRAVSIPSLLVTYITSGLSLVVNKMHIPEIALISPFALALVLIGIFSTIAIPFLTSGTIPDLPSGSERRIFVDPHQGDES